MDKVQNFLAAEEREARELYESDGHQLLLKIVELMKEAEGLCDQFTERHPEECECAFCQQTVRNTFGAGELSAEIANVGHNLMRMADTIGNEVRTTPEKHMEMFRGILKAPEQPAVVKAYSDYIQSQSE